MDNPYLIKKQNELKKKQAEPCYSLSHLPVVGLIKPVGIALLFGGMVIGKFSVRPQLQKAVPPTGKEQALLLTLVALGIFPLSAEGARSEGLLGSPWWG